MIQLKKHTAILLLAMSLIMSCNSNDAATKHQEILIQQEAAKHEPANLLEAAKTSFSKKEYDAATMSLNEILNNNSQSVQTAEAASLLGLVQKAQSEALEKSAWEIAINGNDISAIENFVTQYPTTVHSKEAEKKIKQLKIENEQTEYDNAINRESSSLWKEFLNDYPERTDIDDIKRKIIKAEISEIKNQEGTLDLPASSSIGTGSGSNSSIMINNNTEYVLTVRYSGPTITSVDIPSHGVRSVSLRNGVYDVAATAGSTSCAGSENMDGSYEVTYYITTTRSY